MLPFDIIFSVELIPPFTSNVNPLYVNPLSAYAPFVVPSDFNILLFE